MYSNSMTSSTYSTSSWTSSESTSSIPHDSRIHHQTMTSSSENPWDPEYKFYRNAFFGCSTHPYFICPKNQNLIILNIQGSRDVFCFKNEKIEKHFCEICEVPLEEQDLWPIYARENLIFMKNLTFFEEKIQKFILTPSGFLEEVSEGPEFDPKEISPTLFSAGNQILILKDEFQKTWKKMRFGQEIPKMPVRRLPISEDVKNSEDVPCFNLKFCPHFEANVIRIWRKKSGILKKFIFDDLKNEFVQMDCYPCRKKIEEKNLFLKYSENFENLKIIHAYNQETEKMEQFIYLKKTNELQQVDFEDVKYDEKKDSVDDVICEISDKSGNIRIRKNPLGGFFKEVISKHGIYQILPKTVHTLKVNF